MIKLVEELVMKVVLLNTLAVVCNVSMTETVFVKSVVWVVWLNIHAVVLNVCLKKKDWKSDVEAVILDVVTAKTVDQVMLDLALVLDQNLVLLALDQLVLDQLVLNRLAPALVLDPVLDLLLEPLALDQPVLNLVLNHLAQDLALDLVVDLADKLIKQ